MHSPDPRVLVLAVGVALLMAACDIGGCLKPETSEYGIDVFIVEQDVIGDVSVPRSDGAVDRRDRQGDAGPDDGGVVAAITDSAIGGEDAISGSDTSEPSTPPECPTELESCVPFDEPLDTPDLGPVSSWVGLLPFDLAPPIDPFVGGDACPEPSPFVDAAVAPQGEWQHGMVFPFPDPQLLELLPFPPESFCGPDEPFGVYCHYTFVSEQPLTPEAMDIVATHLPDTAYNGASLGNWLEHDLPVVVPLGASAKLLDDIKTELLEHALDHAGVVDALPALPGMLPGAIAVPPVTVAVLDTALPDVADDGTPGSGQSFHGRDVSLTIRRAACPGNAPGTAGCAAHVRTHLALQLEPDGAGGSRWVPDIGGYYGTPGQVARALYAALLGWVAEPGDTRLVINLSIGWEGGAGGQPLGSAAAEAVRRVLRMASCMGVLVVAAVGNDHDGPTPSVGPMYPAAWEAEGADLWCPAAPGEYRPLVHAVAGLDGLGREIALSRVDALPRLAAYAFQVAADDTYDTPGSVADSTFSTASLTGTSMSTAFVSSAAALVWGYAPSLEPAEVMQVLYDSGDPLFDGSPADVCMTGTGPCAPPRRVRICSALKSLGDPALSGLPCDPAPATYPAWPDDATATATATADALASGEDQVLFPVASCGSDFDLHTDPLTVLPPRPCPDRQLYNQRALPMVDPQPGDTGCDVCDLAATEGSLLVQLSDNSGTATGIIDQLSLNTFDSITSRVHEFDLGGPWSTGTLIRFSSLGTTTMDITRAQLNFVVTGATGRRIIKSDEVNLAD